MSENRDKLAEDYVNKKYTKHQTVWFAPADLIHESLQNFKAGWDAREDEVTRLKDLLSNAEEAIEDTIARADDYADSFVTRPIRDFHSQLRASTEGEK